MRNGNEEMRNEDALRVNEHSAVVDDCGRTGIFVGSFNPFTVGHDSIVRRALPLFDRMGIGAAGD